MVLSHLLAAPDAVHLMHPIGQIDEEDFIDVCSTCLALCDRNSQLHDNIFLPTFIRLELLLLLHS